MKAQVQRVGLDVGSTTAKLYVIDEQGKPVFSLYQRHSADIGNTLTAMFAKAQKTLGDPLVQFTVTGSAAMGLAEKSGVPFVQEVIAAGEVTHQYFSEINVLIDIGGEDSKMIFFAPNRPPDIRMNGSCAGGTGAFIDQMAALLGLSLEELNILAENHRKLYPIASRCGVFAKTDVQNLVSRNIDLGDICASILQAVVVQNINTLARGAEIKPLVMFCGGPLSFLSSLRDRLIQSIGFEPDQCLLPEQGLFLPAWGAALHNTKDNVPQPLSDWMHRLAAPTLGKRVEGQHRLAPLFRGSDDFQSWETQRNVLRLPIVSYDQAQGPLFLGIDSGSTTTKVMLIDQAERIVFSDYSNNRGKPVDSVLEALERFRKSIPEGVQALPIAGGAVTGYGEDLIRAALDLDMGVVETLAHWRAAAQCDPDVSFILDIGGQDMKAIFIQGQGISRIEINEACSSGCGSFIEGFAQSLGLTAETFAQQACDSAAPCDLGTRCTVFMNSRIKQAQREEAPVEDIAAGLAYAVIKNSLYKVLKLRDPSELGDNIVVQGGTFRNPAVQKALEELTGHNISSSDHPEMMGALGAALLVKEACRNHDHGIRPVSLDIISIRDRYKTRQIQCNGCTNHCAVTVFSFDDNRTYHVGNKCERIFTNRGIRQERGENLFTRKNELLFAGAEEQGTPPAPGQIKMGIPRVLEIFESFPFWHTLLSQCGFQVILSEPSSQEICDKGLGTVMSDNICFPAKLAHGHMVDLVEKGVDRIFYPQVVHEPVQDLDAANSYNCPIVSGYADVLKGAMGFGEEGAVMLDAPALTFQDTTLLKKGLARYLKQFNISRRKFKSAFKKAMTAQQEFNADLVEKGRRLLKASLGQDRPVIVLGGRPYHIDPFIEHQTSEIISDLGATVLPVEVAAGLYNGGLRQLTTIPQWAFPNRLLKAAQWVAMQDDPRIQYVMLNSFGCGPDAFIMDEIRDLLSASGKTFTLIKIDDISSTGSVRLRLRSLVEALQWRGDSQQQSSNGKRKYSKLYQFEDREKTIIAPYFADCYAPFFPPIFKQIGYDVQILPPADTLSAEYGLTYANNEICYPATLVIGDFVKAFKSGAYDPERTVAAMSQTGGQCRASSYVALIKKALVSAGYPQVPVIAMTQGEAISNEQPGFVFDMRKVLKPAFHSLLFADAISALYHKSAVREREPGMALSLRDHYLKSGVDHLYRQPPEALIDLLEQAVEDFNQAVYPDIHLPRIGIVGEIYLKFNRFSQLNVTDWIMSQGVEAVVPSLLDFIIQFFVNHQVNRKNFIEKRSLSLLQQFFLERQAGRLISRFDRIMQRFHYYTPAADINHKARSASDIINLVSQFGEGWLIPAEIACYAQEGINDVVCLQPFGCTSNHVIAKGIERKIKRIYPSVNLLFLDFDAGTSEVNVLNRLHFMVTTAKAQPMKAPTHHRMWA